MISTVHAAVAAILANRERSHVIARSAPYPTAIAANHTPKSTCLLSDVYVCMRACSDGTSSAVDASSNGSSLPDIVFSAATLTATAMTASAMITPIQSQELLSTTEAAVPPLCRTVVVWPTPVAYQPPPS